MFDSKNKALLFVVCSLFICGCRIGQMPSFIGLVFRSLKGERYVALILLMKCGLCQLFQEYLTYPLHSPRFEEEERMKKYLQGQRRQGLEKVTRKIARALGYSCFSKFGEIPPLTSFKFSIWFAIPRTVDEDKNDRRSMQIQLQSKWDRFFKLFVVCFIHLVTTSEAKAAGYDG